MPAAPPALPTWDQVTSDPRYQNLPGGERLGILDNYDALIKNTLGDGYNPDDVAPYLDAERQKIAAEGQGPISTAARSFMTGAGQVATGAVQGLGTFGNDAAAGIDQLTGFPGAGSAVVNQMIPGMAGYRAAVPYAEAAQQEIERTYAPDQLLNPISATIGGGAGQAVAMLPSMIAGPVGPLALGAMQGYQQGAEQATDLGIENPFGRMALGAGFAGSETALNRLGGIGSGPMRQAMGDVVNRIAGQGLKTIASEAIEEPLTGIAQDAMSLGAGYLAGTEQAKLDPLMPTAPGYLERRGMEALGGAVGGTVFAGLAKLGARGSRERGELPPPPLPGQPPPLPVDGALPTGNEGASDEEFTNVEQTLAATTTSPEAAPAGQPRPNQTGVLGVSDSQGTTVPPNFASVNDRNVPADATGLIVGEAQDIVGSTPATGTTVAADPAEILRRRRAETNPHTVYAIDGDVDRAATQAKRNAAAAEAGLSRDEWEDQQAAANVKAKKDFFAALNKGDVVSWTDSNGNKRTGKVEISLSGEKQVRDTTEGSVAQDHLYSWATGEFDMNSASLSVKRRTQGVAGSTPPTGTNQESAIRNPESGIRNPEPTISNQAPVPSIDNIGTKFAPPQVRAVPVIPDSPLGVMDSLDFLNEMPIAIGRSGTGGELDWQETASIPKYYRPFIASEQGQPIDTVAQAAYEANLIPQPTADALMQRVQQDIGARRTYRVQSREQTRDMLAQEKQAVSFDKSQNKLERQPNAQPVPTDALVTGDRMTIDGEEVTVRAVESDEDGYPTKVVLEDGKRFGVQEFNPQTKTGLFVDEFQPRARAESGSEGPFSKAGPQRGLTQPGQAASPAAMATNDGAAQSDNSASPGGLTEVKANGNIVTRVKIADISYGELPGVGRPLKNGDAKPILLERTGANNEYLALIDGYHRLDGMIDAGELEADAIIVGEADARALDNNSPREIDRVQDQMAESVALFRTQSPQSPPAVNDNLTESKAGPQRGLGRGLGALLGTPPPAPKRGADQPLRLTRTMIDQVRALLPAAQRPVGMEEMLSRAENILNGDSNFEVRKSDPTTIPQALQLILGGANPTAIVNRWAEHRNQAVMGQTTAPTPFTEAAATNASSPRDSVMSAYAQLDRTGQGYVRIPDLARASGLPMADVREVLIDLSDRGAAYLTPADEPRNIPPADRSMLVVGPSGPSLYVTMTEQRNASRGAPRKPPGPSLIQRTVNRWSKATQAEAALTQVVNQPVSDQLEWIDAALTRLHDMYKKGMITRVERDSLEQRFGAERRKAENRVQNAQFAAAAAARATAAAQAIAPPVPIAQKISMAMLGGNPKLAAIIQQGVKAMQNFWNVALPANTRTIMFGDYVPSNRIYGDINPTTLGIRIHSRQNPVLTRGTVYHEVGHALHFIANKMLGRDPHDVQIIQPVLDFLKTTKSGARLDLEAANLQTDIDNRLKTIQKAEAKLARWQADSRMISIKGPPPKVPAPFILTENDEFIQYLAEPHEQFARAVHAATVFLNGETLNTHAEPNWEGEMSFDLDEIQAIIKHVRDTFANHLPVYAGGPSVAAPLGMGPTNSTNVGGANASPGQAPGTPSLAAPGRAAGNDALTPSQAVPLREEFGGAFPGHVAFTNKAMTAWAEQTAAGMTAAQIETAAATGRYDHVQLPYILTQGLLKSEREVRTAKTQAERTRAQATLGRLRDQLNPQNSDAGQALVAQKLALAPMREMMPSLAVDEAVEKGQTAVIDPTVGGSVQPAVKGLQDLTNQASAEATDELTSELEAEDLDLEAEPSTPAEQNRADEEMIRLRQELTAGKNALTFLTATWQKILATFTAAGQNKGAMVKDQKARMAARLAARKAAGSVAGNRVQSRGAPAVGVTQPALPATAVEDGMFVIIDKGIDFDTWQTEMVKLLGAKFAPQINVDLFGKSVAAYEQDLAVSLANVKTRVKAKATKQGKGKQGPAAKVISARFPNLGKMLSQLRPMIAPGLNWKQIFTSTATQQRQWELDTYAAIRQHPALQSLNAEQAKNLTRELSKAWQSKRRTVWKRELNRTLIAAGMAKPKIRAKIEASAPRLLALINLGALDARTFRDAVAKEFGLRSMNDAEVGKIKEAAEKLQGLAPGTVPYRKAAQKFMEGLESLTNLSRAQLLESWWTASVLSGWRTQMDILFGVSNAMEDIGIGAVVGAIRTGNYGVASRAIFATIERAIQAVPEAFQMVVTGNRSLQASFDAEIRAHLEEGYPMMGQAGRQLMAKGGWRTGFGAFQVAMGRIMSALDHITSSGSRAGALWLARANHPEIFAAAVNITAQDRANARKQALQILTGGTEPTTTQLKQEVKRYTQELLDARHTLPDIEQQASDVGLQSSLQSDPTGLGFLAYELLRAVPQKMDTLADRAAKDNWVPTAVKLLRMGGQFSRVLFGTKFIRTAGNAITRSTNYVPGIGALNLMDGRSKIGSPAGDIILGKQLLGLVLFSGLLYAFRDREEDDDMGIEGGWKDLTADQRGQLLNQGKQPYSVWYRDAKGRIVSINYQQWSVANLLAAVGFTQDQRRYHGVDADAATVAQGLGYGLMTIADKAQLQGISTILGRDNNRSSSADTVKGLNKWAAGLVGGMSPRLVKDIEDVIKPQLPRTDYWWQAWAREVPILRSQSSGARVDIFGREITIDRKPLSRIYQTGTVEPEYQILAKLNQRDVWISDPTLHPRKVKLSTGSRDMLPLEKDRYAREAGKMTKDWLLQTGPQLLQMEPEQAQKMISQRTELIRAMALNRAVRR